MDMAAGVNDARLHANLIARLDAAEAASREAASDQPLAQFPNRLESR